MKKRISLRKFRPKTGLEKATKQLLVRNIDDKNRTENYFRQLSEYGCQTGMVGGLIYNEETIEFFRRNREEIADLLSSYLYAYGVKSPYELFGSKFDHADPLCVHTPNQNFLAWFAFEETAKTIAYEIGL